MPHIDFIIIFVAIMEIKPQQSNLLIELKDIELLPQYVKMPHTLETNFLFCESGRGIVTIDFEKYYIQHGSFITIFSDVYLKINSLSDNARFKAIRLDNKLFDEISFNLSSAFWPFWIDNPVFHPSKEQIIPLQAWFIVLKWILSSADSNIKDSMIHKQLNNLLLAFETECKPYLDNYCPKERGTTHRIFNNFWKLLAKYGKMKHDVQFYADQLNITSHYLAKITKELLHASPKECINWQIILELKQILKTTDLTIKEIAEMFGFESSSYLISYFRQQTGTTPGNFRKL